MTTKAARLGESGDTNLGGIAICSNHNQRPDRESMYTYGAAATPDKPWELRLKSASGNWEFSAFISSVTHQEGDFWLLVGSVDGVAVEITWSVLSRQGTLRYT